MAVGTILTFSSLKLIQFHIFMSVSPYFCQPKRWFLQTNTLKHIENNSYPFSIWLPVGYLLCDCCYGVMVSSALNLLSHKNSVSNTNIPMGAFSLLIASFKNNNNTCIIFRNVAVYILSFKIEFWWVVQTLKVVKSIGLKKRIYCCLLVVEYIRTGAKY